LTENQRIFKIFQFFGKITIQVFFEGILLALDSHKPQTEGLKGGAEAQRGRWEEFLPRTNTNEEGELKRPQGSVSHHSSASVSLF